MIQEVSSSGYEHQRSRNYPSSWRHSGDASQGIHFGSGQAAEISDARACETLPDCLFDLIRMRIEKQRWEPVSRSHHSSRMRARAQVPMNMELFFVTSESPTGESHERTPSK